MNFYYMTKSSLYLSFTVHYVYKCQYFHISLILSALRVIDIKFLLVILINGKEMQFELAGNSSYLSFYCTCIITLTSCFFNFSSLKQKSKKKKTTQLDQYLVFQYVYTVGNFRQRHIMEKCSYISYFTLGKSLCAQGET